MVKNAEPKYPKLAGVGSETLKKRTRKTWDQWVEVLDKAGARHWTFQETVAHLRKKHKKSTTVQMFLVPRENGTTILAFQHEKLRDGRLREPLRTYWKEIVEEIVSQTTTIVES